MENQRKAVCTIGIAVINIVVFVLLSFGGQTEDGIYMLKHGAMYTPYIVGRGEYYRLFTSMFLHFGFTHLMNNMVTLLVLGHHIERVIGKVRLIVIYLLSGLGGNLLSFVMDFWSADYKISAGASGAIFGLTGAMLYLVIGNHGKTVNITKERMVLMTVISLYSGFSSGGVDNLAHIGGLVTGIAAAFLLCRKSDRKSSSLS